METLTNSLSLKSIEKVLEESQYTCEINLSGRKLKQFPDIALHFDLQDVISADLSKNCLTELPDFLCSYISIEEINCCSNNIRFFPLALTNLQNLVLLNLSKNQLSVIPPFLCQLTSLQILRISNNRLTSLPDSIGNLLQLKELDVNSNYITNLPDQLCKLRLLKCLYARKNKIVKLPTGLFELELSHLDLSINQITHLPFEYFKFSSLECFNIDYNPLLQPPSHIVVKGKLHVLNYLRSEYFKTKLKCSSRKIEDSNEPTLENSIIELNYENHVDVQTNENNIHSEESLNGMADILEKFVDERDTPEGGNSTDISPRSKSPIEQNLDSKSSSLKMNLMPEMDLKHIGFIVNEEEEHIVNKNGYVNGFDENEEHFERCSSSSVDSPLLTEGDEFRNRHHNLSQRRKLEAEKIKKMLKDTSNENNIVSNFPFSNDIVSHNDQKNCTLSPLPAGCLKALEVLSHELEGGNPVFTIRRNLHQAALEREHCDKLKNILETRLKIIVPDNELLLTIRDGVLLCQLANHISPNSVANIYTPTPNKPKLSESKCRKNVESFLTACRKAGLNEDRICCDNVILECLDVTSLCNTLCLFIELSQNFKQSTV